MKVAELIELLQDCPQDYEVVYGEADSGGYLAWLDVVIENDEDNVVILKDY
jgi:hypothetical protein